jgi:hypothetical protein
MGYLPEASDQELIRWTPGDPQAFGELYRRHERAMLAYFVRATRSAELAADLTTETFATALRSIDGFRPERGEPIVTWAYSRPKVAEIPPEVTLSTPAAHRTVERALKPLVALERRLNRPGGPCHAGVTSRCVEARRALNRRAKAIIRAVAERLDRHG